MGTLKTRLATRSQRLDTDQFENGNPDCPGSVGGNDAIQKGIHPAGGTKRNVENFKRQLQEIGAMEHWSREINTPDRVYYKWTRWIFVKMFNAGLAYKTFMPLNWCASCKTG